MKIRNRIIAGIAALGVTAGISIANAEASSALNLTPRFLDNSGRSVGVLYGSCNASNPWAGAVVLQPGRGMKCSTPMAYMAPPGFIANRDGVKTVGGQWRTFGAKWYTDTGALVRVQR